MLLIWSSPKHCCLVKSSTTCLHLYKLIELPDDKINNVDLINSLPNDKLLDWSKLTAFAAKNTNLNEKLKFVLGRVENIVGNGENSGYLHFLLFSLCFSHCFQGFGDYVVRS